MRSSIWQDSEDALPLLTAPTLMLWFLEWEGEGFPPKVSVFPQPTQAEPILMLKIPWAYPPATAASLKALPKPSLANQVTTMFPVLLHHSKTREMALQPKVEREAAEASQGATKAARGHAGVSALPSAG